MLIAILGAVLLGEKEISSIERLLHSLRTTCKMKRRWLTNLPRYPRLRSTDQSCQSVSQSDLGMISHVSQYISQSIMISHS